MKQNSRILIKLLFIILGAALMVVLPLGVYYFVHTQARLYERLEQLGNSKIDIMEYTLDYLLRNEEKESIQRIISNAATDRTILSIRVIERDKRILAHSDYSQVGNIFKGKGFAELLQLQRARIEYVTVSGEKVLRITRPLRGGKYDIANEIEIVGIVQMEMDTTRIDALVLTDFFRSVLFSGASILLALTTAFLIFRRVFIQPVQNLIQAADRAAEGDLEQNVRVFAPDELGRLTERFNSMLLSLAQGNQELIRSNKELEHFAYVASHDLQEPLRSVIGFLQLLEKKYKDRLDEKGIRYISRAVDGTRRMQTLTSDLLDYSRVSMRQNESVPVDVDKVLKDVQTGLNQALNDSKGKLEFDNMPIIKADPSHLHRLFQNLIGNAIKFQNSTPPLIKVKAESRQLEWYFSIQDNGIGIDSKFEERIFTIFQRLHSIAEYPGTGVGLAICKRIVERHGGRIWFESKPGEGTTFFFTIAKPEEIS